MKNQIFAAVVAPLMVSAASAQEAEIGLDGLLGTWDVALYFSPSRPPSSTVMVIEDIGDRGALEGTFYGTPFDAAMARVHEGEVVFTLITKDGSGIYATSGRLGPDGSIKGQTLSVGRDFIMPWDAERTD